MTNELTEQERDAMAHAIGRHSAKGCSVHGGRNYAAVLDVLDAWNVTAGEAFKRIASCRKGYYA